MNSKKKSKKERRKTKAVLWYWIISYKNRETRFIYTGNETNFLFKIKPLNVNEVNNTEIQKNNKTKG